jgi:putative transposase
VYRSVTYKLQPTARQLASIEALFSVQRELWNAALEERRKAWAMRRHRVTRYEQFGELAELRVLRPDLGRFGVCVSRGTLARLDLAYAGFFRRVKRGEIPGHPRFRGPGRFSSVSWPDASGWNLCEGQKRVYLQGVGHIRVRLHRRLRGTPKTSTLRRVGKRYEVTIFCADVPLRPGPKTGRYVGVDLGVAQLFATSDGDLVGNERPGRAIANRVAALQRERERHRRGSVRSRRITERIADLRRREARRRRDRAHKLARSIVERYEVICVEDLKIKQMTASGKGTVDAPGRKVAQKSGLNKSILDSGWGQLLALIGEKAEEAARQVIAVDARYTSRRCAICSYTHGGNRPSRGVFRCLACGHEDHADLNAAKNILRAGLALREKREAAG